MVRWSKFQKSCQSSFWMTPYVQSQVIFLEWPLNYHVTNYHKIVARNDIFNSAFKYTRPNLCSISCSNFTKTSFMSRGLFKISRPWVPLLSKSQKIVGALMGAPVLDLKNRGCLAPMAPTLKRPLKLMILLEIQNLKKDRKLTQSWI